MKFLYSKVLLTFKRGDLTRPSLGRTHSYRNLRYNEMNLMLYSLALEEPGHDQLR
jgi:hypothetical protein